MISVSDLATYVFCDRKLFLQQVLKFVQPPTKTIVQGSIRHQALDEINKADQEIITSITSSKLYIDIYTIYRKRYYSILTNIVRKSYRKLKEVNLDSLDIFHTTWPLLLHEAQLRSTSIFNFMQQYKVYGEELWHALTPKYLSEFYIKSEKLQLKGIIDKIKITPSEYVPVEIKTGSIPPTGIWPSHKIQIGAYIMLLKEQFPGSHGIILYTKHNIKRVVILDKDLETYILNLIAEIHELLKATNIPRIIDNKNKCNVCSLREKCYSLG